MNASGIGKPAGRPPDVPSLWSGDYDRVVALADLLRERDHLCLYGPAGVGKSALAAQVAQHVRESAWSGPVWYCDLADCRTQDDVLLRVAWAIEHADPRALSGAHMAQAISRVLGVRGTQLAWFDNVDLAMVPLKELLTDWGQVQGLRTLVTCRSRRIFAGGVAERVAAPDAQRAVVLFSQIVGVRAGEWTDDDRATVLRIVERLDRIPLAIRYAAARVGEFDLNEIERRLGQDESLLSGTGEARQASLTAAVRWTWDLLPSWQQDALQQLAVFEGGFTSEAAAAVLQLRLAGRPPVPAVLQSLVDRCVVRRARVGGSFRYWLYAAVKSLAISRSAGQGLGDDAVARHRDHVLDWCRTLTAGPRTVDKMHAVELEWRNLEVVIQRFPGSSAAAQAALCMGAVLAVRGPADRWRDLLDVSLANTHDVSLRTQLLVARGQLSLQMGWDDLGATVLTEAASADIAFVDPGLLARAHGALACALSFSGHGERAIVHVNSSLELARSAWDPWLQAKARQLSSWALAMTGHFREARAHLRRVGEQFGLMEDHVEEGATLAMMGWVCNNLGDVDEARVALQQARDLAVAGLSSRVSAPDVLMQLAGLEHDRGELALAEEALLVGGGLAREVGRGVLPLRLHEGWVLVERRRFDEAEGVLMEVCQAYADQGMAYAHAVALGNLGFLHHWQGQLDMGRKRLEQSLELFGNERRMSGGVYMWGTLGGLLAEQGELKASKEAIKQGRKLASTSEDPVAAVFVEVRALHLDLAMAAAAQRTGRHDSALATATRRLGAKLDELLERHRAMNADLRMAIALLRDRLAAAA